MPIKLYIVRHGECERVADGHLQGQTDTPLTRLGVRQAEAAADRLASDGLCAVYSSDLSRCVATAQAIASRHDLPVRPTPLLRECCLGDVEGRPLTEFEAVYPQEYRKWREDPITNRPPGAERFEEVIARCREFLTAIRSEHGDGGRIAVAAHVGSTSGLICAAFDLPVRVYLAIHVSNASLSVLELGGRPALRLLNDTCHLAQLESRG